MDTSIAIDGEGLDLQERAEPARVNGKAAPVRQRRFFRPGHHIAYAALAAVLACEIIAAAIVGDIVFTCPRLKLFELGNYPEDASRMVHPATDLDRPW